MKRRYGMVGMRPGSSAGFSLIEVMIAILVLGFGLLGFALLQTMSVRFAQSANQRTQMTNLVYELFDQMRANQRLPAAYAGSYTATTSGSSCVPPTGNVTPAEYRASWQCRLGKALGAGATATVERNGDTVSVAISWNDDRWVEGASSRTFSVSTEL